MGTLGVRGVGPRGFVVGVGRVDLGELLAPALFDRWPLLLAFEPKLYVGPELGGLFSDLIGMGDPVLRRQVGGYVYLWSVRVGLDAELVLHPLDLRACLGQSFVVSAMISLVPFFHAQAGAAVDAALGRVKDIVGGILRVARDTLAGLGALSNGSEDGCGVFACAALEEHLAGFLAVEGVDLSTPFGFAQYWGLRARLCP